MIRVLRHRVLRPLRHILQKLIAGSYGCIAQPSNLSTSECQVLLDSINWSEDWIKGYILDHLNRFLVTVDRLYGMPRSLRVLELGAMPYVMTVLLRHFVFDDIKVNVLPSQRADDICGPDFRKIVIRSITGQDVFQFSGDHFNIESDTWPYSDESIDVVIACEIMEHLTKDPMNAVAEANRVLVPGGLLVISTPNAISFRNAVAIHKKRSPGISPEYRWDPYDRHNRELSPSELAAFMTAGGFDTDCLETMNFEPKNALRSPIFVLCHRLLWGAPSDRHDFIFALGRKVSGVRQRYPTEQRLYAVVDEFKEEKRLLGRIFDDQVF